MEDTPRPVATNPNSDFTLSIDEAVERYARAMGIVMTLPSGITIIVVSLSIIISIALYSQLDGGYRPPKDLPLRPRQVNSQRSDWLYPVRHKSFTEIWARGDQTERSVQ